MDALNNVYGSHIDDDQQTTNHHRSDRPNQMNDEVGKYLMENVSVE